MSDPSEPALHERLASLVDARVRRLQRDYRADRPEAVATLALLRRAVTQAPGHDPRVIPETIEGLYPPARRLPDHPTEAERAAHAAMTLFAIHQQSHREHTMHQRGYSFGRSARLLGAHTDRDGVRRRFNALTTAESWEETLHHARSIVQQLRTAGIALDYGRFARDLYWLQSPEQADRVRLTWGRDYYRARNPEDTNESDADSAHNDDDQATEETP